ncbi:mechanosensitive ion channel family protein [Leptolyngbya sp. CCNP1308]|uniref:mechanosensitive ion channel family protein n=1 Tax=Leptolyngbya sp. CCNP1308 TaxID=3110255 RepID=UPI002B207278|nr:mechanosensitive ion channel family protein [Leptolyngbya sp. CCNP1308]MEA5448680.1 mechanosensitive ion channel family protein [Leptolyngbya sp. CCNP1308]
MVQELRQAVAQRQPAALRQQFASVAKVVAATLVLSLILFAIRVWLGRYEHRLHQRRTAESALIEAQLHEARETDPPPHGHQDPQLRHGLYQHLKLEHQLQAVRLVRWLLFWGMASLWALSIAYSLNLFPQTRQFAQKMVLAPVVILLTWFVVGLSDRLISLAVDRFIQKFAKGQPMTSTNLQRIHTIAQVIKGVKTVVVYIIGLIWVLQWLSLVPGSVLALGTLVALVLSFAAQNLVKDLVNGFLILLEDQFRIGDVIMVGDIDGFVEDLNLRVTQLRNPAGELITLPNSSITHVRNMTRHWSRTTIDVEVAYNTDVNQALAVVRETADELAADPEWGPQILDTHEFFGVQEISHSGILIRIWIKTIPLKQWLVSMEFRRRLKMALDRHHIAIGSPRQVWLREDVGAPESSRPMYSLD